MQNYKKTDTRCLDHFSHDELELVYLQSSGTVHTRPLQTRVRSQPIAHPLRQPDSVRFNEENSVNPLF